ncbi:MAG: carbon-nitrogen hydrolase [Clostridiaceae bacterium]|jgi:predicted amidohydrolase|nr:carbon-nitrogen hydrolase [Clostridiaceae bacterium]
MSKINVGIIQMTAETNKQVNMLHAKDLIIKAAKAGAEILVLPEMFICPYSRKYFKAFSEEVDDKNIEGTSETLTLLTKLARELNVYIICGSIPEMYNDFLYNTSYILSDSGEIIGKYRKIHLFDINIKNKVSFRESDTFASGDKIITFNTKWGKMGIAICFDIRFNEQIRKMALNDVKIVFVPAVFNPLTGKDHWDLLFRSRAVDNQIFMVGCCSAKNPDLIKHTPYGHSLAVNPWGNIIGQIPNNDEDILMVQLDLDEINSVREQLPVLSSIKNDLY